MSKSTSLATFFLLTGICTQAVAQDIDLASTKCANFLKMSEPNASGLVTWFQGYYTYEDDPVVMDYEKLKAKEAQIKEYCLDHGDSDLVSASAIFMDKKYDTAAVSPTGNNSGCQNSASKK